MVQLHCLAKLRPKFVYQNEDQSKAQVKVYSVNKTSSIYELLAALIFML